jgi:hypothetical protein
MCLREVSRQVQSIVYLPCLSRALTGILHKWLRHIFGPVTHFSLCKTGGNHEASRSSQHCEVGRSYWWRWKWSFPHVYEIVLHVFFLSKTLLIVWTFKLALFRWSQISWLPFYSLLESSSSNRQSFPVAQSESWVHAKMISHNTITCFLVLFFSWLHDTEYIEGMLLPWSAFHL